MNTTTKNLYDTIFSKMAELGDFNFSSLWTELDSIQAPSLEKLQTIDQLISSCLIETTFDHCNVRLTPQKKKDM